MLRAPTGFNRDRKQSAMQDLVSRHACGSDQLFVSSRGEDVSTSCRQFVKGCMRPGNLCGAVIVAIQSKAPSPLRSAGALQKNYSNFAGRFSRNAACASLKSGVCMHKACATASASSADSKLMCISRFNISLVLARPSAGPFDQFGGKIAGEGFQLITRHHAIVKPDSFSFRGRNEIAGHQ